ncbi:NUDIX domain-containing protein [Actinomyces vulturis]|uniref:NUDIX domain-containing protein n=1 Tax=Actinomyces vulturis TaxID=1857645 RepID=UPI000833E024|nr:NUDIX domain-containing protein [Actinomyces vulturis]
MRPPPQPHLHHLTYRDYAGHVSNLKAPLHPEQSTKNPAEHSTGNSTKRPLQAPATKPTQHVTNHHTDKLVNLFPEQPIKHPLERPSTFLDDARYVVGACLVDSLDTPTHLIAARRSYPEHLAGRYEFPGGKVEHGESPAKALCRELMEELSLTVTMGRWIKAPHTPDGAWPLINNLRMFVWLCHSASLIPPSPTTLPLTSPSLSAPTHIAKTPSRAAAITSLSLSSPKIPSQTTTPLTPTLSIHQTHHHHNNSDAITNPEWTSHSELRWLPISEALSVNWLEPDYPIVEYIMTNL